MKMSDINENLSEAPQPEEFGAKQGLAKRLKAKAQKHTPFSKEARRRGESKEAIFKQATQIKNNFKKWVSDLNAEFTSDDFIEFIGKEYDQFLPYVEEVAVRLEFHDKPEAKADDTASNNKPKRTISKEPPEKISPEEEAKGRAKEAAAAEAEAKELGIEEDETNEEVNVSASIYESRLAAFLVEKELKDNQLDTLIVRMIQAAKRGEVKTPTAADDTVSKEEPADKEEKKGFLQRRKEKKAEKAAAKQKAEPVEADDDDDDNFSVPNAYRKDLRKILKKVIDSDQFDKNETKDANGILKYV